LAISELRVCGYRSIRRIELKLKKLTVLVGPNGCGKSNFYRSMYLLAAAAGGQFARALAEEGGLPSVLWAGARKTGSVRMDLGVTVGALAYDMSCGMPKPAGSRFDLDPWVREERVDYIEGRQRTTLLERGTSSVWLRDDLGQRVSFPMVLAESESVFSQLREPHKYPHLSALREEFLRWRFYHHFRTDPDAPIRHPQVGVRTPVLTHDGRDLAAALQTIREIGDSETLDEAIELAFPGATLVIDSPGARFSVMLEMPGIRRPFDARELSDGTLRYLCLVAALLSPRPPALLALNEPETSIHPDLLEPLAQLIVSAAESSQLWITTHSEALAAFIQQLSGVEPVRLEKVEGATRIVGQKLIEVEDDQG
jgi:predicted ATPase